MDTQKNKKDKKFFKKTSFLVMLLCMLFPVAMKAITLTNEGLFMVLSRTSSNGKIITNVKTFPDGVHGYCLEWRKPTPGSGSDIQPGGNYANENVWKAIKYGFPNNSFYNTGNAALDRKLNFYVTQVTVWSFVEGWQNSDIDSMVKASRQTGIELLDTDIQVLKNHIKALRTRVVEDKSSVAPEIGFSPNNVQVVGQPGKNAQTQWITVNGRNLAGNVNITLEGAPAGTTIKGEGDVVISSVPVGGRFYIDIPNSALTGSMKFKLSGNGQTFKGIWYEGGAGNQDVIRYEPVSIAYPAAQDGTVTWTNTPGTGKIQIKKVSADRPDQVIGGVTFDIFKGGNKVNTVTTNSEGLADLELEVGDYTAVETDAPPQFVLDPTPSPFTVVGGETSPIPIVIKNFPVKAKVSILKEDLETKELLAGAKFTLSQGGTVKYEVTTKGDGIGVINDVIFGEYDLTEILAPEGYVIDTEVKKVNITTNGQEIAINTPNKKIKGDVEVLKKDSENAELIKGAVFGLFKGEEKIAEQTTNEAGIAYFKDVEYGIYTLKELQPAEGYLPNTQTWEVNIDEDGEVVHFDILNEIIKGKIQIVKIDGNDEEKPVKGAVFELYKASDMKTVLATLTTDEDGFAYTEDLRYGDYVLKEVDAPGDYYINDKLYPVSIREHGKVVVKYIVNMPVEFRLKVLKVDGKTKTPLEGAHFQIHQDGKPIEFTYQAGSQIVKENTFVTDKDGLILLPEVLRAGKYELVEVKAPTGYLGIEPIPFEVTRDSELGSDELGPILEITVENEQIIGDVELVKTSSKDNKPLKGVKFELYKTNKVPDTAGSTEKDKEDNMVEKFVKDVKRLFIKDLNAKSVKHNSVVTMEDTSLLRGISLNAKTGEEPQPPVEEEVQPPTEEGQPPTGENDKPTDNEEEKPPTDNEEKPPTDKEEEPSTDVESKPTKEASENLLKEEQKPLANGDLLIGLYETNKDGYIRVNDLSFGDYYFKEVKTAEGFVLDDKPLGFQITEHKKTISLSKVNKPIVGKVEISKEDISTGVKLPDTGIKIWAEDKTTIVTEGRTDENGKLTFELEYGKYYFQEFDAPNGYVIDETLFPFEIKENGEIVKCIMTNKKIEGELEITKVDISDGKLLPDTTFAIYNETGKKVVVKGKTDDNGMAKFKLPYGKYFYQEIEAPKGYLIDQTKFPFEIKTNGEIIKCKMTNTKLPKTGTAPVNTLLTVAPIAVVGASGAILVFRKRK